MNKYNGLKKKEDIYDYNRGNKRVFFEKHQENKEFNNNVTCSKFNVTSYLL